MGRKKNKIKSPRHRTKRQPGFEDEPTPRSQTSFTPQFFGKNLSDDEIDLDEVSPQNLNIDEKDIQNKSSDEYNENENENFEKDDLDIVILRDDNTQNQDQTMGDKLGDDLFGIDNICEFDDDKLFNVNIDSNSEPDDFISEVENHEKEINSDHFKGKKRLSASLQETSMQIVKQISTNSNERKSCGHHYGSSHRHKSFGDEIFCKKNIAPKIQSCWKSLEKQFISNYLKNQLLFRPDFDELLDFGFHKGDHLSDRLHIAALRLENELNKNKLKSLLQKRPTLDELKQKKIYIELQLYDNFNPPSSVHQTIEEIPPTTFSIVPSITEILQPQDNYHEKNIPNRLSSQGQNNASEMKDLETNGDKVQNEHDKEKYQNKEEFKFDERQVDELQYEHQDIYAHEHAEPNEHEHESSEHEHEQESNEYEHEHEPSKHEPNKHEYDHESNKYEYDHESNEHAHETNEHEQESNEHEHEHEHETNEYEQESNEHEHESNEHEHEHEHEANEYEHEPNKHEEKIISYNFNEKNVIQQSPSKTVPHDTTVDRRTRIVISLKFVAQLAHNHAVNHTEKAILKDLILSDDPKIIQTIEEFTTNQSVEQLTNIFVLTAKELSNSTKKALE